ncbi:MAG: hypothetical protein ACTSYF_04255 [Promethearchaeota archaeon]
MVRWFKSSFHNKKLLNSGPILEEGLIIGFSILALLIIISIIISVLNWSQDMVNQFIDSF